MFFALFSPHNRPKTTLNRCHLTPTRLKPFLPFRSDSCGHRFLPEKNLPRSARSPCHSHRPLRKSLQRRANHASVGLPCQNPPHPLSSLVDLYTSLRRSGLHGSPGPDSRPSPPWIKVVPSLLPSIHTGLRPADPGVLHHILPLVPRRSVQSNMVKNALPPQCPDNHRRYR